MVRIFKNKYFSHWASKSGVPDSALQNAVDELVRGLFEVKLGGIFIKKGLDLKIKGKEAV